MAQDAKTKPEDADVAAFLAAVEPVRRREEAATLDAMFRRVSGECPILWGPSIVGYGAYDYRYESGRTGTAPRIGFSPRKPRLVLYVLGGESEQEAELLGRLGKHSTGKGCLYITALEKTDPEVLEQLVRHRWNVMAVRYPPGVKA